nr:DUF4148 domain-containing protein [Paraburkholderia sp. Tr-20389]
MGGLALGAVVLHIESNALSDLWPFHHDDVSATDDPQNAPPPVNDVPSVVASRDDTSDADIAFVLQSVSDNLQRNDLTAAKVLLDEVLAVHSDLPQALALQQELRARELKAAHTTMLAAVADNVNTQPSVAGETGGTDRTQERTARTRQVASHGTSHVKSLRGQRKHMAVVSNGRPKTRAEVVAELRRARVNGTMPNFGGRQR